jgi:tripartite-type tricarboxylate transporter receptor subunit TctC
MRRLLYAVALTVCAIAPGVVSPAAFAQAYPNKPIRMIVPFPPGGTADILGRAIGQKLAENVGQQVIVENRAGANGNIGAQIVAKSPPDGYTLLMSPQSTLTNNPSLYSALPFDTLKDFAPITLVAETPHFIVVHPSVPAKTVGDLIALAKAKPGYLTFASAGSGSSLHLSGELFKSMSGIDIVHIPYKGAAPAVTDLLGGQVSMMFDTGPSALPHVRSGKTRAIAVTTAKRSRLMPDLPTVVESGLPGYDVTTWFGLVAPSGTPREIVTKLNTEVVRILQAPEVKERLETQAADPVGNTPEEFAAIIRADIAKWGEVIKLAGVRIE